MAFYSHSSAALASLALGAPRPPVRITNPRSEHEQDADPRFARFDSAMVSATAVGRAGCQTRSRNLAAERIDGEPGLDGHRPEPTVLAA